MQRFKSAVKEITVARNAVSVTRALARFLDSLTAAERRAIEDSFSGHLSCDAGQVASLAYDLRRCEIRRTGGDGVIAAIAEAAEVYAAASNRLAQLAET